MLLIRGSFCLLWLRLAEQYGPGLSSSWDMLKDLANQAGDHSQFYLDSGHIFTLPADLSHHRLNSNLSRAA